MIFVFGGAYQGKLDLVKGQYGIDDGEIFDCSEEQTEVDEKKRVFTGFHRLVLGQLRAGKDPLVYLREKKEIFRNKIIISEDSSCGIVPIDEETRFWREMMGRCHVQLAKEADQVVRVFCGLGQRIK